MTQEQNSGHSNSHICVLVMPLGPHEEECNWWHGGVCDCKPEMIASRAIEHHCHECDYVHSYQGDTPCNCEGYCICERLAGDGCDCIGRVPVKVTDLR